MPDWIGTFQNRARHDCSKRGQHCIDTARQAALGRCLHMGDLSPPPYGGDKCRGQSVNGGGRGHRPYGGT